MTTTQRSRILALFHALFAPRWKGSVADWCETNIRFNEPKLSGPMSFAGRQYFREPLEFWADEDLTDGVLCWGTRTGKTRINFGGLAWKIVNSPTRALWVMPNSQGTGGAQNVSRTRFQPMIRATQCLAELIPAGARRHEFKSMQMMMNGSIIDVTGANSPANLAGNPCDTVIQDEVDKYQRRGEAEADPSKLADNRCKEFSTPKRFKNSTPTLVSGIIWQELLKSDIRRRFLPCPFCNASGAHNLPPVGVFPNAENAKGWILFAWSERFTVLKKTGCEAYVKWDKTAKDAKGNWDLDKVEATAHAECPHCHKQIRDAHKVWMDENGEWRATQTGTPRHRGWHLPSMYSVSAETTFGRMAVRFLTAKKSIIGLQDFINSDLAEPYQSQDTMGDRVEIITSKLEITAEWNKLMTVDCQAKAPHFWYVVAAWNGPNSDGIEAGSCDTWDEVRKVQIRNGVKDVGVFIDSGWGAKSDAEVYRECVSAENCQLIQRPNGLPMAVGWIPLKGMPGYKRWKEEESGLMVPFYLRSMDPFIGSAQAGMVSMQLFEFSADFYEDILEILRKNKKFRFAISEQMNNEEFFRHMDGTIKATKINKFTGHTEERWIARHRYWPNHIRDCYRNQCAAASFHKLLPIEDITPSKK